MWVYDIECLKNYFLVCFLNAKDGSRISFEISDFKNDLTELKKFLRNDIRLIGYNCLNYDSQLIEYIIRNHFVTAKDLYRKSQEVIDSQFPDIPEWKLTIPHLDLFRVWHFDNKAKATSLKWLQFMMDWHNIEEMPLDYWKEIKEEDRKDIESYCWNDVESTLEFFKITRGETELFLYKGKDKIDLRKNINEQFNVNCYNWNDVKIGDKINQKTYLKLTQQHRVDRGGTKREFLRINECISNLIEFKTPELISFFNEIKDRLFYPDRVKENPGWKFNLGNLRISFGFGGIHSIDNPRKVEATDEFYILDRDVALVTLAQLKLLKLTGISLESYLLNLYRNIIGGVANYNCIVKKIRIGQSAAKIPLGIRFRDLTGSNYKMLKFC